VYCVRMAREEDLSKMAGQMSLVEREEKASLIASVVFGQLTNGHNYAEIPGFSLTLPERRDQKFVDWRTLQKMCDAMMAPYPEFSFETSVMTERSKEHALLVEAEKAMKLRHTKETRAMNKKIAVSTEITSVDKNVRAAREEIALVRRWSDRENLRLENKMKRDKARHERNQALANNMAEQQQAQWSAARRSSKRQRIAAVDDEAEEVDPAEAEAEDVEQEQEL